MGGMNDFDPRSYVDRDAAWEAFKRLWFKENPPLDNGYYMCGISGHWVKDDEVTLDHIELRDGTGMFDPNNIQPACGYHNYIKGSRRWKPKVNKEQYQFLLMLNNL